MSKLFDDASLAMIPSAYKDGKLYSIRPTDGSGDFTFSRGSNLAATRVDVNGLIEKGRENRLLQSNQFDTTWTTASASVTSGQTGYDGSNDAWLLNTTGVGGYIIQSVSLTGVQTLSVYAKAGSNNFIRVQLNGAGADKRIDVNLVDGSTGTAGGGNITASTTSVGGGWWRIQVVANTTSTGARFYAIVADGDLSASSGNVYIQDAQLEAGLVATDYIETGASTAQAGILEDMPRLDYSGGASCPALLLEPQRTNLLPHSEYIGAWTNYASSESLTNETSPEGKENVYKIIEDTANSAHTIRYQYSFSNITYTISAFLKGDTRNKAALAFGGASLGGMSFEERSGAFDLSSGVIDREPIGGSATIDEFDNGWYRCSITITPLSAGTANFDIYILDENGNITYQGDGSSGIYVYGAQLEEGSYPTSYIPTYGSSVTRSDDGAHISLMQSNNIVGAADSYTIFFDISNDDGGNAADGGNSQWLKGQDSPSYSNIWTLRKQDVTDQKYHSLYYNKDSVYVFNNETINKGCVVFTANEIKVFLDGSLNTTYSVTNSPLNLNGFRIDYGSSDRTTIEFSQLAIFPTALTDSECIALTTL